MKKQQTEAEAGGRASTVAQCVMALLRADLHSICMEKVVSEH